ncbi:protein PLASTID REDOX INSENSITIVE 2-like [Momordica charantia]|uniref:Protein PLASTID REDOX INSENSITIVE 2-like n=1 Tax=Momordica charantia TaxID=3673 RepID=A0A6J1DCY7_MOMCH|nr:protein PLASTID REDOX INSENSITIVE 2-like [Momordica charantia]
MASIWTIAPPLHLPPSLVTLKPSIIPLRFFPNPSAPLHRTRLSPTLNLPYPLPGERICRAAEYKFPDPIPEFAVAETEKFRAHLLNKLSKKDMYGDSVPEVVGICTEIFNTFMHTEYGGPGTLLVVPFIDMSDTINERGLPGGPQAARAAVKWAQDHVDKDWNEWTGDDGT